MAYRDPEEGRARDRERFRRRTAKRIAQGLCPNCGKEPPEPERRLCAPCAGKRREAERVRDATRRAAGKPRRNKERARDYERERSRRRTAERIARGSCTGCGKAPAEPERTVCGPCAGKRRAAERARYAKAKAAGKLYGGRDPKERRRNARGTARRRYDARREAGLCTRCGLRPPVEGGTACEPCREARRAGRTPAVGRAADGRPVRPMRRRACVRRRLALRPLRRAGGRTLPAQERRQPQALRQATGAGPLHRLRSPIAGGGKVRTLRAPVPRTLGPLPRHPSLAGPVHRHRDRDRRGPRDLRQHGRSRRLPRLRQAVLRSGRGARRRLADGHLHRIRVTPRAGASRRTPEPPEAFAHVSPAPPGTPTVFPASATPASTPKEAP